MKHTIAEFPYDPVRIECTRCDRSGRYAKTRLIGRFGADAKGPDVLTDLAACDRRRSFGDPCGARFTDLVARR